MKDYTQMTVAQLESELDRLSVLFICLANLTDLDVIEQQERNHLETDVSDKIQAVNVALQKKTVA